LGIAVKKLSLIIFALVAVVGAATVTGVYFASNVSAEASPNAAVIMPTQMYGYGNYTYYPYYGGYGMGMGMMGMMSPIYGYANWTGNYSYPYGYGMMPMGMMGAIYPYGLNNYSYYGGYGIGIGMCPMMGYGINGPLTGYGLNNYTYYVPSDIVSPYSVYNSSSYPSYYSGYGMGMGMCMGMGSTPYGMNGGYYNYSISPTPSPSVNVTYSSMKGRAVYLGDGADSDIPSSASAPSGFIASPYAVAGLGIGFLAFAPITWKLLHRRPKT
jgi:hypothetical protein